MTFGQILDNELSAPGSIAAFYQSPGLDVISR
jgi:hypothetical protein